MTKGEYLQNQIDGCTNTILIWFCFLYTQETDLLRKEQFFQ